MRVVLVVFGGEGDAESGLGAPLEGIVGELSAGHGPYREKVNRVGMRDGCAPRWWHRRCARNLTSANPEHSISYPPPCPAQEPDCANRMLEMNKTTDTSRLCVGIPFPA